MTASHNPSSDSSANQPAPDSLRWEGHMSDDVAATFGPVPGAVLTANADELWLKGNRGDFRIPRSAVVKIGRGGFYPWFFRGVGIRNNVKGFPTFLQFAPMDGKVREIRDQLKSLGFPSA